tara:strand:- start:1890 stop:2081 length:192 start_codon:yes stop_codon:yes gene_type:complete
LDTLLPRRIICDLKKDKKLVAANTRDMVFFPQDTSQGGDDMTQYFIAPRMSVAVVDRFEVIKV